MENTKIHWTIVTHAGGISWEEVWGNEEALAHHDPDE
jgi:hypothetical protein